MRLVPPERGLRNGRSGPAMDRNGSVSNVLRARHERGMFTGMADSAKWLPVPEEVANGKEWLETYSWGLRIRDGEHKLQIALALARYAHRLRLEWEMWKAKYQVLELEVRERFSGKNGQLPLPKIKEKSMKGKGVLLVSLAVALLGGIASAEDHLPVMDCFKHDRAEFKDMSKRELLGTYCSYEMKMDEHFERATAALFDLDSARHEQEHEAANQCYEESIKILRVFGRRFPKASNFDCSRLFPALHKVHQEAMKDSSSKNGQLPRPKNQKEQEQ